MSGLCPAHPGPHAPPAGHRSLTECPAADAMMGLMGYEIVIIGAGIAGLSAAAELAQRRGTGRGILVLEAGPDVALQTSARSAQQLIPSYGPAPVLELTRWSIAALREAGRSLDHALVWPNAFIVAGSPEDVTRMTAPGLRTLGGEQLFALCPELRRDPRRYRVGAVDHAAVRSDAPGLLRWHRTRAETLGVQIRTRCRVVGAERPGTRWRLRLEGTRQDTVLADTVVNAAGAWAEEIGRVLGASLQGLQPKRRTAALVRTEVPVPPDHPMVMDAAQHWYYRPDPQGLMVSVGESEPSEACDAQPHPGAVERLVATVQEHTALRITGVVKSWTGLRTERASDVPVCGWDTAAEGVFWLAGQGGYGFQTSAALAAAAAEQLLDGHVGPWLSAETVAALQPEGAA